jgi:hypothetical protein
MNKTIKKLFALFALSLLVSSCNSIVHDDIENCPEGLVIELTPRYAARNVFEGEVNDVHITLLDANKNQVTKIDLTGEELKANNYLVDVPVAAGDYDIVVWNGLSDTKNYTLLDDLGVVLNRDNNETANEFAPLWHGSVDGVTVEKTTQTHVVVPMVKDTKNVVAMLHDTSGNDLDLDRFSFYITAQNGAMARDNSLTDDTTITYRNFKLEDAFIDGTAYDEDEDGTSIEVARGEINTLRLTTDRTARLVIDDNVVGKPILNVNLNQLILLARSTTGAVAGLSADEYFDSQDHYDLTFFLQKINTGYFVTQIIVNSWVVRLQNIDNDGNIIM